MRIPDFWRSRKIRTSIFRPVFLVLPDAVKGNVDEDRRRGRRNLGEIKEIQYIYFRTRTWCKGVCCIFSTPDCHFHFCTFCSLEQSEILDGRPPSIGIWPSNRSRTPNSIKSSQRWNDTHASELRQKLTMLLFSHNSLDEMFSNPRWLSSVF